MLISAGDLIVFTSAALTLNLTPGNDMMFVLGQAIKGGTRSGIAASLGIATGCMIHVGLVGLGVAVILARHPLAFEIIRYAGSAYLIFLAIKTLRQPLVSIEPGDRQRSTFEAWRDGTLVNVFNAKIIVFMFAFLPPFIRPENGMPLFQLFIFGLIFNLGGTLINFAVSAFSGRIGSMLKQSTAAARWFSRLSAGIFLLLALRIAFERR